MFPGLGYFGALDSDCLDIPVARAVKSLTLRLGEAAPAHLNLRAIEFHGGSGRLAFGMDDYDAWMSSCNTDAPEFAAKSFMQGCSIHSRAELHPSWTVQLHDPVQVDFVRIRNRPDVWGLRSRSLQVSVESADGGVRVMHDLASDAAQDEAIGMLRRLVGRDDESSGDTIRWDGEVAVLRMQLLDALAEGLRSASLPIDSIPWRHVLQLLDIWSGEAPCEGGWTVLSGFLLAQHRFRQGTSIRAFSRVLANRGRLQRLERELGVLARACGEVPPIVTRHGLSAPNELNREPEPVLDHLSDVLRVLECSGRRPVLAYGTLLGAVRESRFIAHDDDVDVLYLSPATSREEVVEDIAVLRAQLQEQGYRVDSMLPSNLNMHVIDPEKLALVDIFPCWVQDGGLMLHMQRMELRQIAPDIIHPTGRVDLHGRSFPAPADPAAFLEARYGAGWRQSDPYFEWPWKLEETTS